MCFVSLVNNSYDGFKGFAGAKFKKTCVSKTDYHRKNLLKKPVFQLNILE